jgi:DNA-binding CsgD family transcriptional regulator
MVCLKGLLARRQRRQHLRVPSTPDGLRRARGERKRPSSGWASLTPTEHQVVRLAVQGLTNPQIGSQLFMSLGTVKTHLSHIFAKLAVSTRAELVAEAVRRNDG